MSDSSLHIERMIIHKVDHKSSAGLQLADLGSPLDDPKVHGFLHDHITSSREHKNSRLATFKEPATGQACVRDMCYGLLDAPDQFVSQSQEIARRLYDTIDKRMSPGDLVLCTFTENDDPTPWLAILKIDPSQGFLSHQERVDGRVRFVLEGVPDVLSDAELQKAAFIVPQPLRKKLEYDLRVLDQQMGRRRARRAVASFFSEKFLSCVVGLNLAERNKTFISGSRSWAREESEWPDQQIAELDTAAIEALGAAQVDVANFAAARIPDVAQQERYLEYLQEKGLDELVFEPDPEIRKRYQYVIYEGDYDARLRIQPKALKERALEISENKTTGLTTVTFKTKHWVEKLG